MSDELNILLDDLIDDAWYNGVDSDGNNMDKYMAAQKDLQSIKQKIIAEFHALNQRIAELEKECEHWHGHYQIKSTLADAQAMQLNKLESENEALRLIAGSHSMSELRRNRILAGWRRGDTLKNEVKHE